MFDMQRLNALAGAPVLTFASVPCTLHLPIRQAMYPNHGPHNLGACRQATRCFHAASRRQRCCICKATGKQTEVRKAPGRSLLGAKSGKRPKKDTKEEPNSQRWGVFSPQEYNRPWQVPWGAKTTVVGFVSWALSFLLTSLLTVPLFIQLTGTSVTDLTAAQKSDFVLINQILEVVVGISIIRFLTRSFEPLPEDVFRVSLGKAFTKPDGWLVWAILGILVAPLAVSLTEGLFTASGYTSEGRSTVDEVVKILSPDLPTLYSLFVVTAILAPILEEFVFRGFLLTSLTKFLPVPAAVFFSSVSFGLAHFSVKDLPELTVLGTLLGLSYIRTRNLLTPIVIHGLWNGTTVVALYVLAQSQT